MYGRQPVRSCPGSGAHKTDADELWQHVKRVFFVDARAHAARVFAAAADPELAGTIEIEARVGTINESGTGFSAGIPRDVFEPMLHWVRLQNDWDLATRTTTADLTFQLAADDDRVRVTVDLDTNEVVCVVRKDRLWRPTDFRAATGHKVDVRIGASVESPVSEHVRDALVFPTQRAMGVASAPPATGSANEPRLVMVRRKEREIFKTGPFSIDMTKVQSGATLEEARRAPVTFEAEVDFSVAAHVLAGASAVPDHFPHTFYDLLVNYLFDIRVEESDGSAPAPVPAPAPAPA